MGGGGSRFEWSFSYLYLLGMVDGKGSAYGSCDFCIVVGRDGRGGFILLTLHFSIIHTSIGTYIHT